MAFDRWLVAIQGHLSSSEVELKAQLWNLMHETRISEVIEEVREWIGRRFEERLAAGESEREASVAVMKDLAGETGRKPQWLGILSTTESAPSLSDVLTHVASSAIRKYYSCTVPLEKDNPPPRYRLPRPLGSSTVTGSTGARIVSAIRFLWVTFDSMEMGTVSRDDPTAVKRGLGLAHYWEGDHVYRFELPLREGQVRFIPTCLDAGVNAAWMPPLRGYRFPWGTTRDLTDGRPRWPELLVETADYLSENPPQGELVSPVGRVVAIGPVPIDYMAGRNEETSANESS